MMLPVDFSSTFSRAMFRVPSLYFLGKAVLIWTVLLLRANDPKLFTRTTWLSAVGNWVQDKPMEDICWSTFVSACLALCIGTLTTGLEGLNINDHAPFNLFAFAFQLYVESAAARHPKEGEQKAAPNVHVVITIIIPLFQLTVMHCLEIKRRWTNWRLAFSAASGLFALLHFHYVQWFSTTPFPLTTYAARVVESIMFSIITLTVALNALTQLLSEGTITRPVFGHSALMPKWDEDFNVALFRLGTASMEATAVAGLGNEVGGVASARPVDVALARKRERETVRGEIEIDRTGVSGLSPAYEQRGRRRVFKKGFANEITDVKVKAASTDFWVNTVLNVAWQRHLGAFLLSAWRASRRVWGAAAAKVRGSPASRERSPSVQVMDVRPGRQSVVDVDPYERFVRGESVSDDEDDEFHPDDEGTPQPDTELATSSDEEESEVEDDSVEQVQLYADLSKSDVGSAPLLLAHMTDKSASPLTRRGYKRLVSGPSQARAKDDVDDWDEFVSDRRRAKRIALPPPDEDPASENARACVICTVEPRDIICWPCRCLALCDDCRNNLASRSSASKHTCPCCRRIVEGYSKIYIP
ncbi:hypothetical protein DICSQDRAFT_166043 [Dichomitus squalens LYAD-421 SS1]|uniref:uncharacterized protein n=1 Tax=Dichomitus squalens (strain LYAD-421) TaxID=732165 RepID=UPI00044148FF|nr:uncharacterized protein DICSQDRAFT_166043 [Dichomitus squalens LYAD-421 SS1]EJF66350.1 hypothetical protein DICSQDRAFT_166043 [Dichomitus squalens LYAD-421 SS1]